MTKNGNEKKRVEWCTLLQRKHCVIADDKGDMRAAFYNFSVNESGLLCKHAAMCLRRLAVKKFGPPRTQAAKQNMAAPEL